MAKHEKPSEVKKTTLDFLDARSFFPVSLTNSLIRTGIDMGLAAGLTQAFDVTPAQMAIVVGIIGSNFLADYYRTAKLLFKTVPYDRADDLRLKIDVAPIIFNNRNPLSIAGTKLTHGDVFYYLRLPSTLTKHPYPPEVEPQLDGLLDDVDERLRMFALRKFSLLNKNKNYRGVCIESDEYTIDTEPELSEEVLDKLFAVKDTNMQSSDRKFTFLSREMLAQFEQDVLYSKLALDLNNPAVLEQIKLAQNTSDPAAKAKIIARIQREFDRIVAEGVERTVVLNPIQATRPLPSRHVEKVRDHQTIFIQPDVKGVKQVRVFSSGAIPTRSVKEVLGLDVPEDKQKPAEQPGLKEARAAFMGAEKVEANQLSAFFRPLPEKKDILDDLRLLDATTEVRDETFTATSFMRWRRFLDQAKNVKTHLSRATVTGMVVASCALTSLYYGNINSYDNPTVIQTGFPSAIPGQTREWSIRERGKIDSSGYYVTSTAANYNQGEWKAINARKTELKLSEQPTNEHRIDLFKAKYINPFDTNVQRIPIKPDTKLSSISVKDLGNNKIDFHTFEIADGTIEIELPGQFTLSPYRWIIFIDASLIETNELGPHAIYKQGNPLDTKKLDSYPALLLATAAEQTKINPDFFAEILRLNIRENHLYSLNPRGKERLQPGQSPEERVNAILGLPGMSCMIAAEGITLLLRNEPNFNHAFSFAQGFLYGVDSLASLEKDGFLSADGAHAFVLDQDGEVIEATPYKADTEDPMTMGLIAQTNHGGQTSRWATPQPETKPTDSAKAEPAATPIPPTPTNTPTPIPTNTPTPQPAKPNASQNREQTKPTSTPTPEPIATLRPSPVPKPTFEIIIREPERSIDIDWNTVLVSLLGGAAGGYALKTLTEYIRRPRPEKGGVYLKDKDGGGLLLTRSDLVTIHAALDWISHDDSAQFKMPVLEKVKSYDPREKKLIYPNYHAILGNISSDRLRAFRQFPDLYESEMDLTDEQKAMLYKFADYVLRHTREVQT